MPPPISSTVLATRYGSGAAFCPDLVEQMAGLIKLGNQTIDLDYLNTIPEHAEAIATARVGGRIVGCCAFKRPDSDYRDTVFERAEIADLADDFAFERGWLCVHPDYRQRGIATNMLAALDASMAAEPAYVTVRACNTIALRLCAASGFRPAGEPFVGFTGNTILLMVRD